MPRTALAIVAAATLASLPASAQPARLMAYSDAVFQENYTAAVVEPFNKRGGPGAEFVGVNSSANMLGQLRTQKTDPQVDVVIMDATISAIACAEGLIEKLTPAMVPAMPQLDPQAVAASNGCGPGVTFDHLVILYDSQEVKPAPTSLKALLDARWKGRVALSAPPNIQALALTAIVAKAEGSGWTDADAAFRWLKTLAPQVQTFNPQPDGATLVLNDTVAFATGWNARSQLQHDRSNGRLGVMLPQEGTVLQINTINLVKGAPHREAGLALLNFALSAEAQKQVSDRIFYAPTNPAAQVKPEVAARTAATVENKGKVVPVDWNEMVRLRDTWTQRWRREVIANSGR